MREKKKRNIKVFGVGNRGGWVASQIYEQDISNVEFAV
jgi:cell division GTPase FtsZ